MRKPEGRAVMALLLIVLVFQLTVLPDTLGITAIARVFNAIALVWLFFAGVNALLGGRAGRPGKAPRVYLVSVLMVIVGISVNISRSLSPESLGAAGALLAWLATIAVPFMKGYDIERSWKLFYRFMLWGSAVSLMEYAAVFSGLLTPTAIATDRGVFLKGIFSIFFGLDDGTVHYRMYGLFAEPGTYAMYLLPAIAYAWLHGKRWPVALFLGCLYLTDSLGGIVGLLVLAATYLFWRARKRPVSLIVAFILSAAVLYSVSGSLRDQYQEKGASADVRDDNVTLFEDNFVSIVTANPFGLPLNGKSLTELHNVNADYIGSNFEIYTVFVKGGILACVGYTIFFVWIILNDGRRLLSREQDPHRTAALICLPAMLLFIFQRDTVLSSAVFGFLFAHPLLAGGKSELTAEDRALGKRRRRRVAALVPIPMGTAVIEEC